jgi:CHAD domain-containing protein
LLRGALRTVTDERPACRVLLSGPDAALPGLAAAIAQELRLEAPPASLAAEAFAVAHAAPPAPRRPGAPMLPAGAALPDAFAFVTGHLADVLLHFAALARDPRAGAEPVHQMRVAVRRLRCCFAAFRGVLACPELDAAETGLKGLGRRLAPVRDWDVFVTETAPAVLAAVPEHPKLTRLLRAADRRRSELRTALCTWLEGAEFRRLGIELAWLAATRSWLGALDEAAQQALQTDLTAFAAAALHRRMRRLMSSAEEFDTLGPAALHAVRLRAKRLRYTAEIFAPLYPGKATRRFLQRLTRLQQRLGEANDASVASGLLAELGGEGGRHGYAVGLVEGFAAGSTLPAHERTMQAWDKFRRQPAFWE